MEYPTKLKTQLKSIISNALNTMHDSKGKIKPEDFIALTQYVENFETVLFRGINKGLLPKVIMETLPKCYRMDGPANSIANCLRGNVFKALIEFKVDIV